MIPEELGADTLPLAFLATLLLTAAIVGIAALGISDLSPAVEEGSADAQAKALAATCQALLTGAPRYLDDPGSPAGATQIVDLSLPASTEFFTLGDEGIISYSVAGTKKAFTVAEGVSFRGRGSGTLASVLKSDSVTLRGGRYSLEIEYTCDALGHRYLLVGPAT